MIFTDGPISCGGFYFMNFKLKKFLYLCRYKLEISFCDIIAPLKYVSVFCFLVINRTTNCELPGVFNNASFSNLYYKLL